MTSTYADRDAALIGWYRQHHRDLPWRRTDDPYAILVSEVMLQQTQASRVADRFERFMERFPTVADLAAAGLTALIAEWSGLGYNTRARRLRDAARIVVEEGWPRTVSGLRRLPGVGPYTAAAVACFAFGAEVPAVDTNLRRVLSRWTGVPLQGESLSQAAAEHLGVPAAEWNQAVMDLGATVCVPRSPACAACPVAAWCNGPDIYMRPPTQSRFEGSDRQVRGAALRALAGGDVLGPGELAERTGFPADRVETVAAGLVADGMIVREGGSIRLAD